MSGRSTPVVVTPAASSSRRDSVVPAPSKDKDGTSVKVVLRIRPPVQEDHASTVPQRYQRSVIHPTSTSSLQVEPSNLAALSGASASGATASTSSVVASKKASAFTFDRVIGPEEGQGAVYACAQPLVDAFLQGINVTVLAYGQTSSGKSYTMGTDRDAPAALLSGDHDRLGITPRAVSDIFERLRADHSSDFTAKVSYLEIYNEDLIDLLADGLPGASRPQVMIREDKAGHIMWAGLREVRVQSTQDVMDLLEQGSAVRQTGSTDMNAQSSRSHAIFSLTVTQHRRQGTSTPSAPPTTPPSPRPSSSRASARLSGIPRVNSPTPSMRSDASSSERSHSRFGLRPSSIHGLPSSRAETPTQEELADGQLSGAATTLTSKWHFVDLAGSERLKRTAAQGERVKEGISINSGLHALGNVISALGDPARARQTTHIPYRDSKLTRLLQDSLGGNAQTLMIACVSPIEYNVGETLSTLKYANRARNIKNRAEVNQAEVGWDDVDYLQKTVLKLRSELANATGRGDGMGPILEENGGTPTSPHVQERYSELTQRCAQLTAELAALQASAAATSTSTGLTRDEFARAVEPIVEEYEKSLSALETQLSLTKAALGHSEEEMRELEQKADEQARANEASLELIAELKSRVAKLAEREKTTEAYVRDIEGKLKESGDHDERHEGALADVRKELSRAREQEVKTEQYVRELEARLAGADEQSAALRQHVETLERDIERREQAHRELEGRLALLDTSGDYKELVAELDARERRLLDLERELDEAKDDRARLEGERSKLETRAEADRGENDELKSKVRQLERASFSARRSIGSLDIARDADGTPVPNGHEQHSSPADEANEDLIESLESRIEQVQKSYERAVADLDVTNAKYQTSLKEIGELHAQLEEARLLQESTDVVPTTASIRGEHSSSDDTAILDASERKQNGSPTTPRTPRTRRSMPLASQTNRLSFLGARGAGATSPSHSHLRSASLSQELSSVARALSPTSASSPRPLSPNLRDSGLWATPATPQGERSYESLKKEILKLQEVVSEREHEISTLESDLNSLKSRAASSYAPSSPPQGSVGEGEVTPDTSHEGPLSPGSTTDGHDLAALEKREAQHAARLDDLMRSMARKESQHKEAVEHLSSELQALRRQHDELSTLSKQQVLNMSSEIEKLREELEGRPEISAWEARLAALQSDLAMRDAEIQTLHGKASGDLSSLESQHRDMLSAFEDKHNAFVDSLRAEHHATISALHLERDELHGKLESQSREHAEALQRHSDDRERALKDLVEQHEQALKSRTEEHDLALSSLRGDHEQAQSASQDEVRARLDEHEQGLSRLRAEHEAALSSMRGEHDEVLVGLRREHDEARQAAVEEHTKALEQLRAEHHAAVEVLTRERDELASNLEELERSHEQSLQSLRQAHEEALKGQAEEHERSVAAAVQTRSGELGSELEEVGRQQLEARSAEHAQELARHVETHDQAIRSKAEELAGLTAALEASKAELERVRGEHDGAVADAERRHRDQIDEAETKHRTAVQEMTGAHEAALHEIEVSHKQALASAQTELANLSSEHSELRATSEELLIEHEEVKASLRRAKQARDELMKRLADAEEASRSVEATPSQSTELQEARDALSTMEKALQESQSDRDRLLAEVSELRAAPPRSSTSTDSSISLEAELAKLRAERDSLASQLGKYNASRELERPSSAIDTTPSPSPMRRDSKLATPGKQPPPPTPPPAVPPPPVPEGGVKSPQLANQRKSSSSSINARGSLSMDSNGVRSPSADPADGGRLAKKVEEQEGAINRLTSQLSHVEGDLQANIDLVNTLESALNDSERNLRKARLQMADLARERDSYMGQNDMLRLQIQEAHTEVEAVRRSVLQVESRLQEERQGRDSVKAELQARLDDAARRKSKFACF